MTRPRISLGMDRFSGLWIWAGLAVIFGILRPDTFLSSVTFHSVAAEQAIVAILALGLIIPLATGVFDLSIGANVGFAAVFVTMLQSQHHLGMWAAIAITVMVSALIGAVNGFVVVVLKVDSFIATLGSSSIIVATQTIVTKLQQPVPPPGNAWRNLTQTEVFGFQIIVVYMLVLGLIVWWVLEHTPFGRYLYAVGGNREAARLSGVRVDRLIFLSLVASAVIGSLAGIFYASRTAPSLTFGGTLLLPAFAAAFLGTTQLKPGKFNVWGTLIAIYTLATGIQGLQLLSDQQWLDDMFNGIALIAAVSLAGFRLRAAQHERRLQHAQPTQTTNGPGSTGGGGTIASDRATTGVAS